MPEEPQYKITIDDDRSWTTNSEFAEYDATHTVIGALLAGADAVSVERVREDDGDA